MLKEMADLGFEYAELSHGIRMSLVDGVLRAVRDGVIKISSCHNFCPLPSHVTTPAPNLYEPTAQDVRELGLWKRNTLRTFDFAKRVNAPLIILHTGRVRFFWGNPARKFDDCIGGMTAEEIAADPKATKMRERMLRKLRKQAPKYMQTVKEVYQEFAPLARERGLKMCIENREGFAELPLDEQMAQFLDEVGEEDVAGYWHDAGHAEIKQHSGIISHEQLLMENSKRQFGFHLHDVSVEGKDHQPLGTGVIDFQMISSFFREDHTLVLELSPRLTTEQVIQSRDYLNELLKG